MLIKDSDIAQIIERISEHYRSNLANRFIRPALLHLPLENQVWERIDSLTERSELYRYQGAHIDELYSQIIACSRFVASARKELVPSLRTRLSHFARGSSDSDKILRDMAINNFGPNLIVFADLVNELFVRVVDFDKKFAKNRSPLCDKIPELRSVGANLIGG